MILSETYQIQGTDGIIRNTGYWLEEFALPYKYFSENGIDITVATPSGKDPMPDPASTEVNSVGVCKNWENPEQFKYALQLHHKLIAEHSIYSLMGLTESTLELYDGVFVPGGYAPMVDLAKNKDVGRVLWYFHRHNLPTALFCHGPIAILSTKETPRGFAYRGYKITAFSSAEEADTDLGKYLAPDAQTALSQAGCLYQKGEKWTSFITRDRELITGQNTQSTHDVMLSFLQALKEVE